VTDDNVIRVPRVTRTEPCSVLSVWLPDETGIATTTFHSLAQPVRPTPGAFMNIDAIRAAVRPAVKCDDFFEACRIMEKAAGIEEPFVVRRFEEMAWRLALYWEAFFEPEDRASSLKHWLIVEGMWPTIKINGKEISQVPG
jgi:hypothetical protein